MADYVTRKLHLDSDTSAVTFCKDSLKRWYEEIYNTGLWIESVGLVEKSVSANDQDITLSDNPTIFYYSASTITASTAARVDRVIAAKFTVTGQTDGQEIIGGDWVSWFQLDPNIWTTGRSTTPTDFISLPRDSSGYCRIQWLRLLYSVLIHALLRKCQKK